MTSLCSSTLTMYVPHLCYAGLIEVSNSRKPILSFILHIVYNINMIYICLINIEFEYIAQVSTFKIFLNSSQ